VTKPLQGAEFLLALRQVLAQRQGSAPASAEDAVAGGRVIVFCAPKGGTGRTTLALNTAISLRQITDEPVVLVDADYAAPALDVALNLPGQRNIADLMPKMAQLDRDMVAFALPLHASHIRVLLAPPPADLAGPVSLPQVQQVVVWLKRMFTWVVVDLGLPLDETAFGFLDGADRIVMTVLPEMVGLRNVRMMLDQFQARGYPEDKAWLVLNRATMVGGVRTADIEERLRVKVSYRVPDDQPLATHSINRGVPIMMSHANSAVARATRGLAKALARETAIDASASEQAGASSRGLLARLRGGTHPAGA
jgi:pilus assembly protein CpaE